MSSIKINGMKKILEGTEKMMEGWRILGIDKKAPNEYAQLGIKCMQLRKDIKKYGG